MTTVATLPTWSQPGTWDLSGEEIVVDIATTVRPHPHIHSWRPDTGAELGPF